MIPTPQNRRARAVSVIADLLCANYLYDSDVRLAYRSDVDVESLRGNFPEYFRKNLFRKSFPYFQLHIFKVACS